jgi:alpha-galactosidase
MQIFCNSSTGDFHLSNRQISYIFKILENGHLGHLYYGKRIRHRPDFSHMLQVSSQENAVTPNTLPHLKGFSLDLLKQEYPSYGSGDYREPAISILQPNGSRLTNFVYHKHDITQGKPRIPGLPATYVESPDEALTLTIHLRDELIDAELALSYTIYRDLPIVTRHVSVMNHGNDALVLERLLSASIDFNHDDYRVLHLSGAWSRERHLEELDPTHSKIVIESKRGASSANNNPFLALKKRDATEDFGEVYGFSLVYSGNHIAQVEQNHMGSFRICMGINPFNFSWTLDKGGAFHSPEVVMVYSDRGLTGMSSAYHNLYRNRLARGTWRNRPRPALINNWEATYFDFDEDRILDIAKEAANLGVELFVLDDGWFGQRNNDRQGLGDWWANLDKLPSGIDGLSRKVEALGLKFGLWFEPEMVNPDSDLYRQHPDWILQTPGRSRTLSRNQHTLDLGRRDVRDYLYGKIAAILHAANVSYIKWDMNRPMTEIWSGLLPAERQGETAHRYMLGLYQLLEKLVGEFPEILFESCASGGNRFDPGMLYYMPQAWCSDDTDAVARLKIQYGTSLVYPISSMGAHVSAVPNHQTGRVTSFQTRGNVAFFGAFGYELDLNAISADEKKLVRKQLSFFKKHRQTLQFGDFHRLKSPFAGDGQQAAWMSVAPDKSQAIVGTYHILAQPNPDFERLKLKGLDPDALYQVDSTRVQGEHYHGDELMQSGLMFKEPFQGTTMKGALDHKTELDSLNGDFQSKIIVLTRVDV